MIKLLAKQTTPAYQIPLPEPVIAFAGNRAMRIHHYMWHQTRNQWNTLTEEQRTELTNRGWGVSRPSQDAQGTFITDNGAGEDFLYMHRQMIIDLNRILAAGNYTYGKQIVGWTEIPSQNDLNWPVPPVYGTDQFVAQTKTEEYLTNTIRPLETRFKDPAYLRTVSLGELGARLEYEIHNALHVRFSSESAMNRPDPQPFWNTDQIDTQYDSPTYDWMNDFYSSHVNVYFWKLHGWVDDRINDWQRANGVSNIQWNNTWMGVDHHNHGTTTTTAATPTTPPEATPAPTVPTTETIQDANFGMPDTFGFISLSSKLRQTQDTNVPTDSENNIIDNFDRNMENDIRNINAGNSDFEFNRRFFDRETNNNFEFPLEPFPISNDNTNNVINTLNDGNLVSTPEFNTDNIPNPPDTNTNNIVNTSEINTNNVVNIPDVNTDNIVNTPDVNPNNVVNTLDGNTNNNANTPDINTDNRENTPDANTNNFVNTQDVNPDNNVNTSNADSNNNVNTPDANTTINNLENGATVMLESFPEYEFLFNIDRDLF